MYVFAVVDMIIFTKSAEIEKEPELSDAELIRRSKPALVVTAMPPGLPVPRSKGDDN